MFFSMLQVLEEAYLLSPRAGLFFYDKDLKLVDTLGSPEVCYASHSMPRHMLEWLCTQKYQIGHPFNVDE